MWQTPHADEPNERLAGLRLGELDLLHGERLAEFLEHGGADTHRADPSRHATGPEARAADVEGGREGPQREARTERGRRPQPGG